jgi:short-subunit dehydrogenase
VDFHNKVVLLTGASSGIGYELAKLLAKENARLVIAARRIDILTKLAEEVSTSSHKVIALKCDVTDKNDISDIIAKTVDTFGTIDAVILNSGTSYRMSIEEDTLSRAEEIMNVNAVSFLYFFNELIPLMKNKGGIIAGVSSLADTRGFPYSGAYSASKAAASHLLESYRIELRKYNIRVITIKPGFVRTPMTDKNKFYMPFLMEPGKAAKIIMKGLKKENRIIQFPLPTVLSAKIVRLIPDFIFDYFSERVK